MIEQWFERTRTDGLKLGARLISSAVLSVMQKHLVKERKTSLRDYQRCIAELTKLLSVQTQGDLAQSGNTNERG